jgi:hypothetical protein
VLAPHRQVSILLNRVRHRTSPGTGVSFPVIAAGMISRVCALDTLINASLDLVIVRGGNIRNRHRLITSQRNLQQLTSLEMNVAGLLSKRWAFARLPPPLTCNRVQENT